MILTVGSIVVSAILKICILYFRGSCASFVKLPSVPEDVGQNLSPKGYQTAAPWPVRDIYTLPNILECGRSDGIELEE